MRVDFLRTKLVRDVGDGLMKELVMHCDREEISGLQEQILKMMVELGLRVRVVPSISKQSMVWEAYNQNGILGMKYTKKYEYGKYFLTVDVHCLEESKLRRFYDVWRKKE